MAAKPPVGQRRSLLDDLEDLVEEPRVDSRRLVQPLDADAATQRRFELEGAVGRGDGRPAHQLVVAQLVEGGLGGVAVQTHAAVLERAKALLQRLGEGAADGHRLADRLHARAEHVGRARELLEGPPWDLGDDVVDGRLEAGRRLPVMSLAISSSV